MKTVVFFTILAVGAALAGNSVSVDTVEPPTEHNAHWQWIHDGLVGCVRDGMNVYGSNDKAWLSYKDWMSRPINIYGYDGVLMRINYSQVTADSGDYCTLYVSDSGYERVLTHEFEDTDGTNSINIMLDSCSTACMESGTCA